MCLGKCRPCGQSLWGNQATTFYTDLDIIKERKNIKIQKFASSLFLLTHTNSVAKQCQCMTDLNLAYQSLKSMSKFCQAVFD